jgi:hypothetical protein
MTAWKSITVKSPTKDGLDVTYLIKKRGRIERVVTPNIDIPQPLEAQTQLDPPPEPISGPSVPNLGIDSDFYNQAFRNTDISANEDLWRTDFWPFDE